MDTQLDPQVVNMAKAIRQSETGGNFKATGKAGEIGAYQFLPSTWKAQAPKYGITSTLDKATPEEQNAVAYNKIKEWKDSGHDVTQIASMWNAGEGEPNAYTGRFSNGHPSIKKNPDGSTKFDVPSYAKSVASAYLKFKNGGIAQQDPSNPSATVNNGGPSTDSNGYDNSDYSGGTQNTTDNTQEDPGIVGNLGQGHYGAAAWDAGKGLLNVGEKALNSISSPFAGLAAIPTQILAKSLGQSDPFQKGIGNKGSAPVPISNLDVSSKGKDLLKAEGITASAIAPGILGGLLKGPGILGSSNLAKVLPVSSKVFSSMSNAEKLDLLDEASKLSDTSASAKLLIKKAMEEVSPLAEKELGLTPGVLSKAIGKTGSLLKKTLKGVVGTGITAALGGTAASIYDHYTR